jgi:predicted RNA-binding Zn ribbon-like protein
VKASLSKRPTALHSQLLAGDLALDFVNSRVGVGDAAMDRFQTDENVIDWLEKVGLPVSKITPSSDPLSLLCAARLLRENIRSLVEKRKAGRRGDVSVLNNFLRYAQSYPQLVWNRAQSPSIKRIESKDRPEALLAPIAEAAAVLLATADFDLVKQCEGETCMLWFSDQTKSHHRRWCSNKICGNRHKVAAYRKRASARSGQLPI